MHLYDLGNRLSWWEFRAWIRHRPENSALVREIRRERAEQAKPEDDRTVGSGAIPIDEMDAWLGWD